MSAIDNELFFNCPEMQHGREPNPNYVEAPYEVAYAFMVPRLNHIHPRRRRLKARRRYVRNFHKRMRPPKHAHAARLIVPRFFYRRSDFPCE